MAFTADGVVLAAVGTNIMFFRVSDGAVVPEYSDGFASFTEGKKGIAVSPVGGLFVRSRDLGEILAARVPVLVSPPSIGSGQTIVRWVGGSGRYQLQRSSGLGAACQDMGGVLTTNATIITPDAAGGFFRVVDLPH